MTTEKEKLANDIKVLKDAYQNIRRDIETNESEKVLELLSNTIFKEMDMYKKMKDGE